MYDIANFKAVLGHYATGLTVIGTLVDGEPAGFTCQSFHSVSMDPPLVSFNVMRSSKSWPAVRANKRFSINVLSNAQQSVSNALARSAPDKWSAIQWRTTPAGNPMLDQCLIWLDCELYAEHDAGDHTLVVARVVDMQHLESVPTLGPLIYFKGTYHSLAS